MMLWVLYYILLLLVNIEYIIKIEETKDDLNSSSNVSKIVTRVDLIVALIEVCKFEIKEKYLVLRLFEVILSIVKLSFS